MAPPTSPGPHLHTRSGSGQDHSPNKPSMLRQSSTIATDGDTTDNRNTKEDNRGASETAPSNSKSTAASTTATTSLALAGASSYGAVIPSEPPSRGPSRLAIVHSTDGPELGNANSIPGPASPDPDAITAAATGVVTGPSTATETTALLGDWRYHAAHSGPCLHGAFSPRAGTPTSSIFRVVREVDGLGTGSGQDSSGDEDSSVHIVEALVGGLTGRDTNWKRKILKRMSKQVQTSTALADELGVEFSSLTLLSYYMPFLAWIRQYKWSYFKGDMMAAITMASFYLPIVMSLADNLAHVPAINGLYAFIFNPLIYALLGTSPLMVVGPEAAGSLLVGTVVKQNIDSGLSGDEDAALNARVCGVVTGIAGAVIFFAGLARLGFVENVLSRPFLRGFISAVGFVIFVDQLVPELGLTKLANKTHGVNHGSSVEKLHFIFGNLHHVHRLTATLAVVSFTVIMLFRELKKKLQPRYPSIAFFPDRFLVVVASAVLTWHFRWDTEGVAILGSVRAASGHLFEFRWPFTLSHMAHIRQALSTSFVIALLGFFESSVAAKSLTSAVATSSVGGGIKDINLSANRELVALGAANLVGACFMALPAFGGYGRSKVNVATGGVSPMSSVLLSMLTLVSVVYLLPLFYYVPKSVLSAMISVVAWSLVEECPNDILFFLRVRGWSELGMMAVIFLATLFYSLSLGIAIGVGLSILQVIRHATRPRIQILGRRPGTNRFDNAESNPERLEFFEGCLIIKIPEPLTFANTGELKTRLKRLERYGTNKAHPSLPRLRGEESNRNVVFDIHGVTELDGSAVQVLVEIVKDYVDRQVRVFFTRAQKDGPVWDLLVRSGIVTLVGGEEVFVDDVIDALRMADAGARRSSVVAGAHHESIRDV